MAQTKESQPEAKSTDQLLVSIGQFAQTWCKPHMSLVIEAKKIQFMEDNGKLPVAF